MFETWADDKAPTYSVQTTHLKSGTVDHAGKAWSTYGGRVGVWRIMHLLDRLGIPGTFFVNARCTEQYPDAVKQIAKSGHDIGGHAYTQDQLLAYMPLEEQEKTIRQSVDLLQNCSGKKVTGWGSPVVAFTPETAGFLAKAGLSWTTDITYVDLPIKIHTPHGTIAGVPTTDFSDNRVLRANPRDLYDTYKGTFDYMVENEPMGLIVMVIHCQFGGRPLISAVLNELLGELTRSPDVWFARHEELARWALAADVDEHSYRSRFFAPAR
jgi:peptidoglycan/xylan/chitin deacetylase (PgdA/CDA1 family)